MSISDGFVIETADVPISEVSTLTAIDCDREVSRLGTSMITSSSESTLPSMRGGDIDTSARGFVSIVGSWVHSALQDLLSLCHFVH